jgi:hypothetical protein
MAARKTKERCAVATRARATVALTALSLLLVGCAAEHSTTGQETGAEAAGPTMHRMPDGTLMKDADMAAGAPKAASGAARSPSDSAAMICATETHEAVQHNLGLPRSPSSTDRWAGGIYTCTYLLPGGDLVASVQDATNEAAGRRYFDAVRARTTGLHPIDGLQNFGLPGYADGRGIVLFLKDGKTLQIDATGLPESVGKYHQSPGDVAYAVAASVLACWSEH